MERIESVNNKIIKLTNSLKIKKFRVKEGLFIAEGERLVLDSMKFQKPEYLIVSENFYNKDFDVKTYVVSEEIFKKLCETVTPQGIIGVFKTSFKDISQITFENTIVLNRLQDPGNLGTILRTAKATGFKNIILDNETVDVYNPKTVRSSMSAVFNINLYQSKNLKEDIIKLKEKGFHTVGTILNEKSKNLYSEEFNYPVAFVIGNEGAGIDEEIQKECDKCILIPMEEGIESLNASVACSVVMYEMFRREKYEK
ncbi:MAG: RNA methyltransferase [Clostridia bacterium]|nr:RNA methyltransferase [Oscillospiraceae bacterium]MBR4892673.1 RNA methyltransferase [Clostridia bacterium]